MKTLLLIALTLSLYACTKCEECTRTWVATSYDLYPDGSIQNQTSDQDRTEVFTACSQADIKAAEEAQTDDYTIDVGGYERVIHYVAECDCK